MNNFFIVVFCHGYDDYPLDFVNEIAALRPSNDDPFSDCNLNSEEMRAFLTPPIEKWLDVLAGYNDTMISMDKSKELQWKLA